MWGSKILQGPPTVTYEDVMGSDDRGLFKWLSNVDKFGFSFVSGVPATPEATEELSRRIAFIRETQCRYRSLFVKPQNESSCVTLSLVDGTFWDFTSNLAKGDTAYTTIALGAHTDTTYFVSVDTRVSTILNSPTLRSRPTLVDCNCSICWNIPEVLAVLRSSLMGSMWHRS